MRTSKSEGSLWISSACEKNALHSMQISISFLDVTDQCVDFIKYGSS